MWQYAEGNWLRVEEKLALILWERYRKEGRKKEKVLFAAIIPEATIVHSVEQDNCDMVLTSANSRTCRKTCPNNTLPITNRI